MTFFKDKTSKQASSLRRQGSSANALQPATLGSCFRRNDKALIVVLLLCAPSVQGQDHAPPSQPPQNQAPAAVKPITYQNLSLEGLRKEMAFVASQIQQQEAAASTIESQLQNIKRQSEEIQSSMSVQKNQLGTGMESLVRLSQTSPLMAFFVEKDANDFVRSGLLLQTILPALKQRSDEMAAQLKQLNDMQAQETIKSQELNSVTQDQLTKKGMLSRLYAIKSSQSGAQPQVEFDKKLLMSSSMEQLLNYVNLRKTAGQEMKQAVAQLALKPPVQGKLLTLYDQQKQYFAHSQGAVIEARSGAQVIAPVESQVVFSGPFREYGNLLILRTQDNYHVVLMGLSKLDVAVGQDVLGGEPIGEMGATEGKVLLGLELRKNTRIIDPTPWVMQWNR